MDEAVLVSGPRSRVIGALALVALQPVPVERAAPYASFTTYRTVWKRVSAGEWRFEVDGGNGQPEQ
jgi:hypothetical protein